MISFRYGVGSELRGPLVCQSQDCYVQPSLNKVDLFSYFFVSRGDKGINLEIILCTFVRYNFKFLMFVKSNLALTRSQKNATSYRGSNHFTDSTQPKKKNRKS